MIPTYECADYLRETLLSVLAQDPGPDHMQIQVVDDASSDDPEAVIQELGAGRVEFFRQPANAGHTANFNTCLSARPRRARPPPARRRRRPPRLLRRHGTPIRRPPRHRRRLLPSHLRRRGRPLADDRAAHQVEAGRFERAAERLLALWPIQPPALVARRAMYEDLGGFDPRTGVAGEDLEMWVRIAAHHGFWYEPRPLALYRMRPGSLIASSMRTARNVRDARHNIELMRAHVPREPGRAAARQARRRCAEWAVKNAMGLMEQGHLAGAAAQIREGLLASPPGLARAAALTGAHRLIHERDAEFASLPLPDRGPRAAADIARAAGRGRGAPSALVGDDPDLQLRGLPARDARSRSWRRTRVPTTCRSRSSTTPPRTIPRRWSQELGAGRVEFFRQPAQRRSHGELQHLPERSPAASSSTSCTATTPCATASTRHGTALRRAPRHRRGVLPLHRDGRRRALAERRARSSSAGRASIPGGSAGSRVGQRLQFPSMVVRRATYERLGGFDRLGYAEDWEMWVRIAAHYPVAYEPEPLALYRVHPSHRTGCCAAGRTPGICAA